MYNVSAEFQHELVRSHRICTRCDIYDRNGISHGSLFPLGGQVNASDDAVRRRATVDMIDPTGTLTPESAADLLTPYGAEYRLYRGIRLPGGVEYTDGDGVPQYTKNEFIPLGVFRVVTFESYDAGDGYHFVLQGYDRSWEIARRKFTTPYTISAGTNFATAIRTMIASRGLTLSYNFATTSELTPKLIFDVGDDPWAKAQEMAQALGMELFMDVSGVCVMRPVPDPALDPVAWPYIEGRDATLLYVDRSLSVTDAPNHIIAQGATVDGDAIMGHAKDTNSSSATYWLGPYGDIPDVIRSPFITSQGMANTAAAAELRKRLGGAEQINMEIIPNPAHEIHDIVSVVRAKSGINFAYGVDSLAINLAPEQPMPMTVKRRQLV